MSTTEKLFVEILRRKERIIDDFKHQVEQFDSHLAATLLLNGITPPPWLLHSQSSDPKEWKKEELISEVLLPHPQVQIPYASDQHFVHDVPAVTGNKKFFTELSRDGYQLREQSDANDGQPVLSEALLCDLTDVAEVNCPMKSPLHQIEVSSDPTHNLDLSLARIQRSRISQKSLKLRSSAKASKTSLRDKCHVDAAQTGSAGTGIVLSLSERINSVEKDQTKTEREEFVTAQNGTANAEQDERCTRSCNLQIPQCSDSDSEDFCDQSKQRSVEGGGIKPPSGSEGCKLTSFHSAHRNSEDRNLSRVKAALVERDSIAAKDGGASALQDLHCSESCHHQTPENSATSGPHSSPCAENLCPQPKQRSVESVLRNPQSATHSLKITPLENVHENSQDRYLNHIDVKVADPEETCMDRNNNAEHPNVSCDMNCEVLQNSEQCQIKSPCLQMKHVEEVLIPYASDQQHDVPAVTGNEKLFTDLSIDGCQLREQSDANDGQPVPSEVLRCDLTDVAEVNCPMKTPLHQMEVSSDPTHNLDLSLARIQRSRIRQKALELRSSAKASKTSLRVKCHADAAQTGSAGTGIVLSLSERINSVEKDQTNSEREEFVTAQHGSANGEQDECSTRSCNLQIPQCPDSDSEDFFDRSKQRSVEGGGIKPPSGLEGCKLTSFQSAHWNSEDRNLSRVEAALVEPDLIAAKDGGASALQDLHTSESCHQQTLENSATSGPHSSPCAENLGPQPKQRSVESVFRNPQSATHSLKITPLKSVHENSQDRYLNHIDVKVADPEETCMARNDNAEHPNVSCDMNCEVLQNSEQCQIKSPCSQMQHVEEVEVDLPLKDKATEERRASLEKDAARQNLADPRVCLLEAAEIAGPSDHVDPVAQGEFRWGEAENDSKLGDGEQSAYSEEPLICKSVPQLELEESLLISANLIGSPPFQSLEVNKSDPIMPVLEGFFVQKGNGKLCMSEDSCSFEKFNFEDPIVERATATEELCKSAYMCTPSSHLLAVDELRKASNFYQSVPAMRNNFFAEEVSCAFNGKSYSDSFPFSVAQNSENKACISPPVRLTLWDRVNSHSGSSRAKASLNPDLPCISEENEAADETQGISSESAENSGKRIPLANIPEDSNCPAPVADTENDALFGRCSLESTSSVLCSSRTSKRRPTEKPGTNRMSKKRYTDKMKASTNMSLGISAAKNSKKSPHHSKPKASLRKDRSDISVKESKRDNIVCNMTSFLPLVQQKQAAGPLTGKRDVKVKALEAAEAAKRQAEKREMDRKMKKEAMKLERARMELENLRRLEQEKKQKEEERKKRAAEIAARKRMREEEENKENERKKKRVEEARKHQEEQKEKLCSKKEEKEAKLRAMHEKKGVALESIPKNKSNMNWRSSEAVGSGLVIPETCATPQNCSSATTQLTSTVNQVAQEKLARDGNQEPSYDMSPYRCSDDEDEDEEEDERKDKFVPSWASKSSRSLAVASQQRWDWKVIFPRKSFCSISEVCLPRKYQLK